MDQRLFRVQGLRPHRLTRHDLPNLAKAMVGYFRKQVMVSHHHVYNVACLHFSGAGISILVRSDDWAKVVPFLKDGSFDDLVVPVSNRSPLNRHVFFDASMSDVNDAELYNRILHTLEPFFTIDFPRKV